MCEPLPNLVVICARSVGFHIDVCAPRQPQQKVKTEAKVKFARRLIDPRRDRFASLTELQAVSDERVARFSERTICSATGETIAASFLGGRAALKPLPAQLPEPFDVAVLRQVALRRARRGSALQLHRGVDERRSLIVTTNLPFARWSEVFRDPTAAAAVIDCIVHHATILLTDCQSYRLKDAR